MSYTLEPQYIAFLYIFVDINNKTSCTFHAQKTDILIKIDVGYSIYDIKCLRSSLI